MYNDNASRSRGYSRSNSSNRNRQGGNFQSRSRFSRGSSFGRSRRPGGGSRSRRFSTDIDISKYIKKAVEPKASEEFKPQHTFQDFNLDIQLLKNIEYKNYKELSPIQDQSMEPIMEGKDIVGIANTGTGKTAAFLIPLIDRVVKDPSERVLVIVPTRELAVQIKDELWSLTKLLRVYSALCIGGASISAQIYSLRKDPNFVIGTPGRLKDLSNRGVLNLGMFKNVVLDEADRMLDMGFFEDIKELLSKTAKEKQQMLFSATLPYKVQTIINTFLEEPVQISVKTGDTVDNVEQNIIRVQSSEEKFVQLKQLLIREDFEKVLVFVNTKIWTERIKEKLTNEGIAAESIHGDKPQGRRQRALLMFRESKVKVLVATDVAARGLDIKGVTHVINYDQPATFEDYVHRIGRTGRYGKKGTALTFV